MAVRLMSWSLWKISCIGVERLFLRRLRSFHSWGAEERRMWVQGLTNFFSWLGTR